MTTPDPAPSAPTAESPRPDLTPWAVTLAVLLLLLSAWLAAGSTGMFAHSLRRALVWLALGGAVCAGLQGGRASVGRVLATLGAVALALAMTASASPAVGVLAVAPVAAALTLYRTGANRRWLIAATVAVAAFGLYRVAHGSSPMVWKLGNGLADTFASFAGDLTRHEFSAGVTFAGLDFLVLSALFLVAALREIPGPKLVRGLMLAAAVAVVHLGYLALASLAGDLGAALAAAAAATEDGLGKSLAAAVVAFVPWNIPIVAALFHLALLTLVVRWTRPAVGAAAVDPETAQTPTLRAYGNLNLLVVPAVAVALAIALGLAATLCPTPLSLQGKKLVLSENSYGNWERPKFGDYGRLSIGMYGMLEHFVRSLGGTLKRSKDLTEADLADADGLILLYPCRPWEPGQLERIRNYVEGGGGLLVFGEHTTRITPRSRLTHHVLEQIRRETGHDLRNDYGAFLATHAAARKARDALSVASRTEIVLPSVLPFDAETREFRTTVTRELLDKLSAGLTPESSFVNEAIAFTDMRVCFDSSTFAIGGWLHSYETLAHPTTLGEADDRNQIGVVIGASVEARGSARPFIAGKWGWNDPGDVLAGESMMDNGAYDAGERLGDVVLAAEQDVGKGRVIVFGDTSNMTNGITIGAHPFTSRLLAYLAVRPDGPGMFSRQVVTILLALLLFGVLLVQVGPGTTTLAAVALALAVTWSTGASRAAGAQLPDGRAPKGAPNSLAYMDHSHLGRFSNESWRPDGTMGIKLTLMRAGYLTLALTEPITDARLERAGLLLSIAPRRAYTPAEREAVRRFVERGGIFILTVSYPDRAASEEILSDFDFEVGGIAGEPGREPQPMGHFKGTYLNTGDYVLFVRFHEAWPVADTSAAAPPKGWQEREGLDESTIRRTTNWYLGKALGAVFPPLLAPNGARILANGTGNHPVILLRDVGRGKVVVVGDSAFALNKNLEIESGQAFEGMRENPHFWRWLLTVVRGQEEWIPPRPVPEGGEGERP